METQPNSYLKVVLRYTGSTQLQKGAFCYFEDSYSLHIDRIEKKHSWGILIERYEDFKVIVISFFLKSAAYAKGIKKFKRNFGKDCIDPLVSLRLFTQIYSICINRYKEYSFCFYALDDVYTDRREDMNRRMSVFTKFLQRDVIASKYVFQTIGNLHDSLYIGYNEEYCTEEDMTNFITFYKPILLDEIKILFTDNSESQKL